MIHDRKVTALVPIKDHSERVKGKNFRDFCGKPLYHHIVHTLDKTYAVDKIVINTDSPRVLAEAPKLSPKVEVLERPKELVGDYVSTNMIFEYDISKFESDIYLQTHATNPLLKAETIADALNTFLKNEENHDSLFSVNCYHNRFYDFKGVPINHDPKKLIRTQDLEPVYEENSCIYVFTKESFMKDKKRIGENPFLYVMPLIEACDIDDEFEFKLAELLNLYYMNSRDNI
jgi:CMP-N-acetylneuraminic acid synthetase